jgi:HSP20 family protein
MPKDHRSFFERLTGSVSADKGEDLMEFREREIVHPAIKDKTTKAEREKLEKMAEKDDWLAEEEEGQLAVDMFQTPNEIIIQAVVAGVKPDELDVSITQDMVTVHGKRQKQREIEGDDYYYQELYWGGFSRSVLLPQEVDPDASEAILKNGLLTVKLPKIDKNRVQKLKVEVEREK